MTDTISIPRIELETLQERARKLALENSCLQLVNTLMNSLSAVPGLENTVRAILRIILAHIGGTNVAIYYLIDSQLHYADVYGEKGILEAIDDDMVRRVFEGREFIEEMREFSDTRTVTPEFTKASYWVLPLTVGERMIGVLKMEGMLMPAAEVRTKLQPFFSYSALVLENEIESHSKLMKAYEELAEANEELRESEDALRRANEELEARVAERTAALRETIDRLQLELVECKRAEEALAKSSGEIYDLYNRAPCGYHSLDSDGVFVQMNDTELQWLGYKRDEIIGRSKFTDLITDRSLKIFQDNFPRFLVQGQIRDLEFEMVRKDGTHFPALLSAIAVTDSNGNYVMSRSSVYDLTERKRAEQKTLELGAIVESSDDAIIGKTLDGVITSWNRGAERIYGYTETEMVGKSMAILVPPGREDDLPQILRKINSGEHIKHYETVRRTKDGRDIPMSLAVSPIWDSEDRIVAASTIARDITERKRTEEALRESEQRVRRKLDAILSPEADIGALELSDIIDSEKIQKLMDAFYELTNVGIGIIDLHGRVLVGTGWQDICTKFHRINPESCRLCIESDLELSGNMPIGSFKQYRCKNNMWDMATPIMLGDKHVGNIFLGQFLFDDETPNYEIFRQQAYRFGFNEQEYIAALNRVPRWSRKMVNAAMSFYTAFAGMIGSLSHSNIKLANALEERKRAENILQARLRLLEFANSHSMDELLTATLDEIEALTGSTIGFYHFLESDQRTLSLQNWSTNTLKTMCTAVAKGSHYDIAQAGVWVDCVHERQPVIHNDYASLPHRKGMPEGHAPVVRELVVPIFRGNLIRAIIGVGNKSTDYGESDIGIVSQLGDLSWDIAERKRAEEALSKNHRKLQETAQRLEQSRNMLQLIMESIPVRVFWKDRDLRYLGCNTLFARDAGFNRPEELLGLDDFAMGWREQAELYRADDRHVMACGLPKMNIVEPQTTPSRAKIWLNTSKVPLRMSDDEVFGVLGVYEDITERKRAEEALRQAHETLRATLDAAPIGIFDVDLEGRVKSIWNPAAEQLLGWRRDEVLGHFLPTVPEESREEYARFREWIRSGKSIIGKDLVRRRKDGSLIEYSLYAAPEYDDDGNVAGNIAVIVDISERKRAEEEIRKLNLELEQRVRDRTSQLEAANQELEAFAYSVSHDLRAPLRHIDGFLELLQKRTATALDERSQHYMATISDATRRMGTLIDDLLSFSRMGRYDMSRMQIDLSALTQEVIREFEPEAQGRAIRWQIGDLPLVFGDRAMLRIVLVNLISNALKFTRSRPQAEIEIGCTPGRGTESIVFVRDNGVGFDMNYADKLFGVFQRLHRADEFEGTGIGLANVHRIINRHGGRTWAEGKVDHGATFYFSIP